MNPKIHIIVPAFNEARNLEKVIGQLRALAANLDILVVDDGSRDATFETARKLNVLAVKLVNNLGIGGAVQTGFKYAARRGYDCALQFDSDGQHDPSQISKITGPILAGEADLVIGTRYLSKTGYRTPLARRAGIFIFSFISGVFLRQRITDSTSGFRAMNKKVLEFFAREYPVDFPDAEAIILLGLSGFRIKEVPVEMKPRLSGHSSTTTLKSLYYPFKMLLSIFAVLLRKNILR